MAENCIFYQVVSNFFYFARFYQALAAIFVFKAVFFLPFLYLRGVWSENKKDVYLSGASQKEERQTIGVEESPILRAEPSLKTLL